MHKKTLNHLRCRELQHRSIQVNKAVLQLPAKQMAERPCRYELRHLIMKSDPTDLVV